MHASLNNSTATAGCAEKRILDVNRRVLCVPSGSEGGPVAGALVDAYFGCLRRPPELLDQACTDTLLEFYAGTGCDFGTACRVSQRAEWRRLREQECDAASGLSSAACGATRVTTPCPDWTGGASTAGGAGRVADGGTSASGPAASPAQQAGGTRNQGVPVLASPAPRDGCRTAAAACNCCARVRHRLQYVVGVHVHVGRVPGSHCRYDTLDARLATHL